jgi:hypothetical protein
MAFVGIVGARKYRDRQSVKDLVAYLPQNTVIVTSSCRGVCTWAKEVALKRGIEVEVYAPDLNNIRSNFEVADRYYQRNRELIEKCDLVHAFLSEEDGCTGGTGFEVDYASRIGRPVELHWESGLSEMIYQYTLPFKAPGRAFHMAWQGFFTVTFA